jgi:hypothetical protein
VHGAAELKSAFADLALGVDFFLFSLSLLWDPPRSSTSLFDSEENNTIFQLYIEEVWKTLE